MSLLTRLLMSSLAVMWMPALAQDVTNGLTVVGHDGSIRLYEAAGEAPPMVLVNGEIASPGSVDCSVAPGHPQCRTLSWLGGAAWNGVAPGIVIVNTGVGVTLIIETAPNSYPPPIVVVDGCIVNLDLEQPNCPPTSNSMVVIGASEEFGVYGSDAGDSDGPPLAVEVVTSQGAALHTDAGPSTYPPPAVVVDGVWVNSPYANNVQIIGPAGELVVFEGGHGEARMPIVLIGDEVLHPGGADCALDPGHAQCQALDYALQGEGAGLRKAPGAVIQNPGSAAILLDAIVRDYPPPVVIVMGAVVNRNH